MAEYLALSRLIPDPSDSKRQECASPESSSGLVSQLSRKEICIRARTVCEATEAGDLEAVMATLSEVTPELIDQILNTPCSRDPCALHVACCHGYIDIIKYLLHSKARTDIVDGKDHTCLMAACFRDNTQVVELLLQQGANPNQKSRAQQTALHVAGMHNAVGSAKLLLSHGAIMMEDEYGNAPWIEAALRRSREFMDFILESPAISRQEKIDALELWGAVCISQGDVDEGFQHLHVAMMERFGDPSDILHKSPYHPVPALDDVSESCTLADLRSRRRNPMEMKMEYMLIFERILGPGSVDYGNSYWPICDTLMQEGRHREALAVWTHAWKNLQIRSSLQNKLHFSKLINFLNQMWVACLPPAFEVIVGILDLVLTDLEKLLVGEGGKNFLKVRGLSIRLLSDALGMEVGDDKKRQVKTFAKRLVQKSYGFRHPLLQQAIRSVIRCPDDVTQLISSNTVEILLDSEADVNGVDAEGNSPLHTVASFMYMCEGNLHRLIKKNALCSITRALMEKGAHADSRNNEGRTPLDVDSPTFRGVLCEHLPLSLKCLATSTILRHKIPCEDRVPKVLQDFIKVHLPGQKTSQCASFCQTHRQEVNVAPE